MKIYLTLVLLVFAGSAFGQLIGDDYPQREEVQVLGLTPKSAPRISNNESFEMDVVAVLEKGLEQGTQEQDRRLGLTYTPRVPLSATPVENDGDQKGGVNNAAASQDEAGTPAQTCCTHGPCKVVPGVEWSCNFLDNTPIDQEDGMDVMKLMSFITLSETAANKGSDSPKMSEIRGTPEFCEACYSKIFESDATSGKPELAKAEEDLRKQMEQSAVDGMFKRMYFDHVQLHKFYEENKKAIDKEANKESIYDLTCAPAKILDKYDMPEGCDEGEAAEKVKSFFSSIGMEFNEKFFKFKTPFDDRGNFRIASKIRKLAKKTRKSFNKAGFRDRKEKKEFNNFLNILVLKNKTKLLAQCEKGKLSEKHFLRILSISEEDEAKYHEEDNLRRVDALESMLFTSNMMEPEYQLVTKNPQNLCKILANTPNSEIEKNGIMKLVKESVEEQGVYEQFKQLSQSVCNNKQYKKEQLRVLCGDIKDTTQPIRLNISEMKPFEKIVYGKMQCKEKLNFVNYSVDLDQHKTIDQVIYLANEGEWRDLRRQHRDLVARGAESLEYNAFNRFLDADQSGLIPRDVDPTKVSVRDLNGQSQDAWAKVGSGADDIELDERIFGGSSPDPMVSNVASGESGERYTSNSDSGRGSKVSSLKDGQVKQLFDAYKSSDEAGTHQGQNAYNPMQYLNKPVTMDELKEAGVSEDTIQKLAQNIQGDNPTQQLLDYLSPKNNGQLNFENMSSSEEKELRKQIAELKEQIAKDRQSALEKENRNLSDELREANERISRLEDYFKGSVQPNYGQGSSQFGRAPAGTSGTEFVTGDRGNAQTGDSRNLPGNFGQFNGGGNDQASGLGTNSGINLRSADQFVEVVNDKGQFSYDGIDNKLVLKSQTKNITYNVKMDKVSLDAEKVDGKMKLTKLYYEGKVILIADLDPESQKAIETFALKNKDLVKANIMNSQNMDAAFDKHAQELEKPDGLITEYYNLQCSFNPDFSPECPKYAQSNTGSDQ